MKKNNLLLFLLLLCASVAAQLDEFDENALFSDTAMIEVHDTNSVPVEKASIVEKLRTSIGGEIIGASEIVSTREFTDEPGLNNTFMLNRLVGSVTLDSRLQNDTKVFGNLEVNYFPGFDSSNVMYRASGIEDNYSLYLREFFMDFNFNRSVYFRIGKQVLQWGRCYFWNPTDLINVERNSFVEKIGSREGVYGARLHVPFGTIANIYSFINIQTVNRIDSIAGTVKFEYLLGRSEMALSVWGKRGKPVVLGYDISSRVWDLDVKGEISLTTGGDFQASIKQRDSSLFVEEISSGATPRLSLSVGRSFGFMGFPNALMINLEGYYNGGGYKGNMFRDTSRYVIHADRFKSLSYEEKPRATKTEVLLEGNLYEPNYHSRYYAALFVNISRLFLSGLTCNLAGIVNIEQASSMVTGTFAYTMLNNVTISTTLTGYIGEKNTEYTMFDQLLGLRILASVSF
ncbi:MAG: hypothetical protein GX267_09470 [Fibrobacter sp.]|jgi:hypothetical protein|nr:hypothetical protein [Fibrobacter sp.]